MAAAPSRVFISYRRDDSAGYARAIGDRLAQRFGEERVFIDVDDIEPGQRFAQRIAEQLADARVLLVLIGRRWAGESADGRSRLADPQDLVRREVEAGLRSSRTQVIPVLLDGAPMPLAAELPTSLAPLCERHALPLDGSRYADDLARLIEAVASVLEPAPAAGAAGVAGAAQQRPVPDATPAAGPTRPPGDPASALPGQPGMPPGEAALSPRRRAGIAPALVGAGVLGAGVVAVAAAVAWLMRAPTAPPQQASAPAAAVTPSPTPSPAAFAGRWQAEVVYGWPNARFTERFDLRPDGERLRGTASFLGVPRPLAAGGIAGDRLWFETRTEETDGTSTRVLSHRYEARPAADGLLIEMQTTGGQPLAPLAFQARRIAEGGAQAGSGASAAQR